MNELKDPKSKLSNKINLENLEKTGANIYCIKNGITNSILRK